MENRVKILIADGNEEFCDHIKRRLEQVPSYEIVGTAADGQRALELMRVTKPDILVLDLMLSKLDGIAVLKRAREMDKAPAALVLTGFMTEYVANMAASLGVQYFMTKPCELDAVAERIHEMTAIDSQLRQNAQRRQEVNIEAMVTSIIHEIGVRKFYIRRLPRRLRPRRRASSGPFATPSRLHGTEAISKRSSASSAIPCRIRRASRQIPSLLRSLPTNSNCS